MCGFRRPRCGPGKVRLAHTQRPLLGAFLKPPARLAVTDFFEYSKSTPPERLRLNVSIQPAMRAEN